MELKTLLIGVLALMSVFVNGQNKIQGHVLDKQTSEPLSYATIGALNLQYGSYTDTSGLFTLYFLNENDSLKISYLGYKSIYTTVHNLKRNEKIYLELNSVQLKEVVINPKKAKKRVMEIGFFSKKSKGLVGPPYSLNIQTTFIPFPKEGEDVIMKSIKFKYQVAINSPICNNSPLRIRILKVMNNGEPGDDIVAENIIFNKYKESHGQIAVVDIANYNILMPHNGVFIALEWVDYDKMIVSEEKAKAKGPFIGTIKAGDSSYSKWANRYNQPKWREMSLPFTFAIGLTVTNYSN